MGIFQRSLLFIQSKKANYKDKEEMEAFLEDGKMGEEKEKSRTKVKDGRQDN